MRMVSYEDMHVAIIGAGLTGLTAAYELQKKGHSVQIFEKEFLPGGLAMGFQRDNWEWPLEKHYHHIFTSDNEIRKLASEIGVPFHFSRPITSSYIDGDILQLDSPLKLLMFSKLTIAERLRMAAVLGYLRYISGWQSLEKYTTHEWLQKYLGMRPYKMLWEPLLIGKFGPHFKDISLSWFWARIKARTTKLGYPDHGFQKFADTLANKIIENGGSIKYKSEVTEIKENRLTIDGSVKDVDAIIVTVPNKLFMKLAPKLPGEYMDKLQSFKGIGALNMVLELDLSFLPDNVYWLNICDESYPFLAVVEHTHYIDKSHYHGSHIVYVGNYLPQDHRYFSLTDEELMNEYRPFLEKIHPQYSSHILSTTVFRVPFAQPIVTQDFSKRILPFQTPLKNVFLANMQQVYPWDRGTNFAVEMGKNVAHDIESSYEKHS